MMVQITETSPESCKSLEGNQSQYLLFINNFKMLRCFMYN